MDGVPEAVGQRWPFATLPVGVRALVGDVVGGIEHVRDVHVGFSPGVAAAVEGATGTCFVKAVHADANPESPAIHRREAQVLRTLEGVVRAPRLRRVVDEGGWIVLVTDLVDGVNPTLPWTSDGIDPLLAALAEVHAVDASLLDVRPTDEALGRLFTGWAHIAADAPRTRIPSWAAARLDDLVAIEGGWRDAAAGTALLHLDVRGDNLLVADGRGTLVDWPWATRGHPLVDVVLAAPCLAMQGGPTPQDLLRAAGHDPSDERVLPLAVATTGLFLARSLEPDPPGLPTVRAFQAAQGDAGLAWLESLVP